MKEFRPAHKVITENIAALVGNIQRLEPMIKAGGTMMAGGKINIPAGELYAMQCQQIGGMCALLDALKDMIIPPTALEGVIAELKKLNYIHAVISITIRDLEQRPKVSVPTT